MSLATASSSEGDTATLVDQAAKVNLGSGEDYRDGDAWLNVDYNDRYDPDVVHNLNERWPFPEDAFEHVLASHVFEHLDDLAFQFREASRVLEPGGMLVVKVPLGTNALTDWTHQHIWTFDTPLQFATNGHQICDDYQFDPPGALELVDRHLDMVMHGPFRFLSPALQRLANVRPGVWTSTFPCSSGELTAVYQLPGGGR